MARFRDAFLSETGKLLDEFDALLLESEGAKALAPETVDRLFRVAHTVKGSAGMMELDALEALTHALEELFAPLKKAGAGQPDPALFDLLFQALDAMRGAVKDYADGGAQRRDCGALIARLRAWRAGGDRNAVLRLRFQRECRMPNVRAYLIVSAMTGVSPTLTCWPEAPESDPLAAEKIRENGLYLRFPADDEARLRRLLTREPELSEIAVAEGFPAGADAWAGDGGAAAEPGAAPSGGEPTGAGDRYVSVSVAKLQELQNLTDELLLARDERVLRRRADALRAAVGGLRMTPASALFQRLHRAAREAGRKLGRDVAFRAEGEDVGVDGGVLDALSESLVQLVRNAVAHGVEPPDERKAKGKPPVGTVTVTAKAVGTEVVLAVADDGRGVSARRVYEAALRRGLATEGPPATPDALLRLMTRAGVTTSDGADELSGRGVGLDVVRSAIQKLRGTLSLETVEGAGSTFRVRVPQSMALMNCVSFGVMDAVFLLPARDVYALASPDPTRRVACPDGRALYGFRGHSLPLIDLGARYGLRPPVEEIAGGVLAVLEGDTSAVAVYADRVLGAARASVKPMPALLDALGARRAGVAGLTLLADQRVGFILDAGALLKAGEA